MANSLQTWARGLRKAAHPSHLDFGAAVAAFERVGQELGCCFVWVKSRFREARDDNGALLLRRAEPVIDVTTGKEQSLAARGATR